MAVSTQHGYLVVWSVNTGRQLVKRKMHCGSVEGLVWRGTREEIAVDRVVEVVDPLETNDHVCSVVMIILVQ